MAKRRIAALLSAALVAMAASPTFAQPMNTNAPDLPIQTAAGERVLQFDFPAFRIGIAEYPDGPTGATVLHFPSAIQPFRTRDDGDVLWTVSTAEVDNPQWPVTALGVAAAEVVWDAILAAHP